MIRDRVYIERCHMMAQILKLEEEKIRKPPQIISSKFQPKNKIKEFKQPNIINKLTNNSLVPKRMDIKSIST